MPSSWSPPVVSTSSEATALHSGRPNFSDGVFLVFLVLAVLAVAWVGQLAYQEGVKTELTKRHGEAWLEWLQQTGPKRAQADFEVAACARAAGKTWAECQTWLTSEAGPFHDQINAFSGKPLTFGAKCDMVDRGLVGALVIERLTPTPAGSAVPVVIEPLNANDSIADAVNLRVSVCDKGAGPIKVGETEF